MCQGICEIMADDTSPHRYLIDAEEENEPTLPLPTPLQDVPSTNVLAHSIFPPPVEPESKSDTSSGECKAVHLVMTNGFLSANAEIGLDDTVPLGGRLLHDDPGENDEEHWTENGHVQFELGDRAHVSVIRYPRLKKARMRTKRVVEHLAVRLIGVGLVIFDIIIVILDIVFNPQNIATMEAYDAISVAVWCYFLIEICLRIFAKGKKFFRTKLDLLDLLIVTVTGSVTIVYVSVDLTGSYLKLVVVFRVLRIFLLVRLLSERKHVSKATRKMVSQNKRRYREDDFDLDLTYITDRVIASSFPSSGSQAIYRNPIEEVARFLDTKHPDHYKVYNLCIERHYDESFFHNRVGRVLIYDHNVPRLKDLVAFCADARQWMEADNKNILFIHCKGGKGRTGLAVCAWLLESGVFTDTKECMGYFGVRRTDYTEGDMYQGVDTPSQSRYVDYFQKIKYSLGGHVPSPTPLTINTVRISGIQGVGKGDGRDLWMEVHSDEVSLFSCDFRCNINCSVVYDFDMDTVIIQVKNSPAFSGDVQIKFKSSNKKIPKAYGECAFFFWFYTGFISDNRLYLLRKDLDNPHKAEAWKVYRDTFAVDVTFGPVAESET
ncbi:phosphatidylinositol 3,4,5-trisphosphate 3-phosphatase TPTE2-like [Acanthaster planci]|uniref:Phosphatidylinositol 3,4,5-trisphosphate 3-phosphatase TPTE2-like n=1 Tax=Acanthaster planci TaxID=133434 RepID=A0A8B7YG37_ACAPL|nr:phosphatidylinositol 3,4,5-trisphosphate 3-phosphatase TPTE2-like [Acanthaster planci]